MHANALERHAGVYCDLYGLVARVVDMVVIALSAELAAQYRLGSLLKDSTLDALLVAFSMACAVALLPVFGVYQSWRGRSVIRLARRVLVGWMSAQALCVALIFALHYTNHISYLWFACWSAIGSAGLIGIRVTAYNTLSRLRHAGLNQRMVALVGEEAQCQSVLRNIEAMPGSGFRLAVIFHPRGKLHNLPTGLRTFVDFDTFVDYVREMRIQELWLALPLFAQPTIVRFVEAFRDELINIRLIPDVRGLALFDSGLIELVGSPAINLAASPLSPSALAQKAMFDRIFSACVLLVLAPLFVAIAVAVKLSSPGPVFFRQNRKGADGRVFRIYKFRSMRLHEESHGVITQATQGDTRITRVGAFLRRTSLDELPQFINVLRGEMSVVGPRPHAIEHDQLYCKMVDRYIHRYRIKPGITGWAQVNGYRGETDRIEKMQQRVEHDLYYLCNWSLMLDLRIVVATLLKGFVHRNAY